MGRVNWYGATVERAVKGEAVKAIYKAALIVERDAKILCPVDTGRLMNSITHDVNEAEISARVGIPPRFDNTSMMYGVYVEMGTSKMAAQPYLRPALEKNKGTIERLLK